MEMHDNSENGNVETYMIQGSQSAPLSTTSLIENIETMYNEGAPDFVADHAAYYSAAAGYGYYCTGFETPGKWGDQHGVFTSDGPKVQYQGGEKENPPYVYYSPSYGYGQSPYNPYNPYIPGAVVGLDGSYMGPQQFLINSQYQDYSDPVADSKSALVNRPNSRFPNNNLSSSSAPFTMVTSESPMNRSLRLRNTIDGERQNGRQLQPFAYGRNNRASSPNVDNVLNSRSHLKDNQVKSDVPVGSGPAKTVSVADEQTVAGISVPGSNQGKVYGVKAQSECPDDYGSSELIVKAYTSRIGKTDVEENIIIRTDQYNKEDFPVDYVNAKFYVIKSYSEDDVHKSVKYNVWSSTPNGNRKLSNAYEDAKSSFGGRHGDCPIFLFFSVNASGQFCGVAEMVGIVDFQCDMDFWHQDKWKGSFPVKWHMIKDVPNSNFRHIILANNENKPVTNSRDTQEISFKQGLEMLKIFKNHKLKTSIFDDFIYYENRQKVIHEGRIRLLTRTYDTSLFVPALDPRKLSSAVEYPSNGNEKSAGVNHESVAFPRSIPEEDNLIPPSSPTTVKNITGSNGYSKKVEYEIKGEAVSTLLIGSLTIDSKGADILKPNKGPPAIVHPKPVETVTIGSMPVKVNGLSECEGPLTFGSLPPDINGLKRKSKQ